MTHLSESALENYLLGGEQLDTATVEEHLLACDDCAAHVRAQIELELQLGEVARAATFCPGCNRILDGDRCDACGATLCAGGYRIERVLVRTTHGRLYSAIDGSGNRVALKELAFVQAPTLESLAAFDRETKFLRALSHPCIPRFHASFIEGTGIHTRMYIAQDLVEGESLLARLQTHWFTDAEIVDIARHVLDILIYLQSLSPMVFHRDIKPANLIVRPDGSIALVDFGAARDVSETMGNTAVGTFGYMPLEQMAGVYDATTDLFALGASLLHLLTRREPWKLLDGSGVGINVSAGLRAYLDRLCARMPEERFPDARAARAALDDRNLPLKPAPSKPRARLLLSTVALSMFGVGVGAVIAVTTSPHSQAPEVPTPAIQVQPIQPLPLKPSLHTVTIEDLLGPGLIWNGRCLVHERLPSGRCPQPQSCVSVRLANGEWPAHCREAADKLPLDTEDKLELVREADRAKLRDQIVGARARVVSHRRGVVAIGSVVLRAHAASNEDDRTYYYAAAVNGPFEIALHGYPRTVLEPELMGQLQWLPPVVLEPLGGTAASVGGAALTSMQIRAALLYADRETPAGRVVGGTAREMFRTTVDGAFELAGFTPGKYHFTVTQDGVTDEFDADLAASMRFDLTTRTQRPRPKPVPRPPVAEREAELTVESTPIARILINGVDTGVSTPAKFKLAPGRHKVTFVVGTTRSAYPVVLKAGETVKFSKVLE